MRMNAPPRHLITSLLAGFLFAQVLTGCADSSGEQVSEQDLYDICQAADDCVDDCGPHPHDDVVECVNTDCWGLLPGEGYEECLAQCEEDAGVAAYEGCVRVCEVPPGGNDASDAAKQAAWDGVNLPGECDELY